MSEVHFNLNLTSDMLRQVAKHNKFQPSIIEDIYQGIRPIIRPVVYYNIIEGTKINKKISKESYILGAASLGQFVDQIQEVYENASEHLFSYGLEYVCMELLNQLYKEFNVFLFKEFNMNICRFEFLGQRLPMELTSYIFNKLDHPKDITYNQAFMLQPKKSVSFVGHLSKDKQTEVNICSQCDNINCPNNSKKRTGVEYSYGYQKIFKK